MQKFSIEVKFKDSSFYCATTSMDKILRDIGSIDQLLANRLFGLMLPMEAGEKVNMELKQVTVKVEML